MSPDLGTLGRLLAFAALIAATEFYALVIQRRAARRRAQAQQEAAPAVATQVAPGPQAFRIDSANQEPPSRWVARWRAMSESTSSVGSRSSADETDDSRGGAGD